MSWVNSPESMALTVVDPVQGEALELASATPERLARLLVDVREHEGQLRELKRLVALEVAERADKARRWTLEAGPYKLTVPSDAPVVSWRVEELQEELDQMVAEGVLDPAAVGRAVRVTVKYEVVAAGMAALLKNPTFAARLAPYRSESEPENRRVSVSRV